MNALPANWRSFSNDELREAQADEREREIWNSRELLSEAITGAWGDSVLTVRGARAWTNLRGEPQSSPPVTLGDEALMWMQRAYNATTDNERSALLSVFAYRLYNDFCDYVRERAVSP